MRIELHLAHDQLRCLPAVLVSGLSALVQQVVRMHALSLVFAAPAHAEAATPAAFLLGLAIGSCYRVGLSRHVANTLRARAWLEIGVVVAALMGLLPTSAFEGLEAGFYDHRVGGGRVWCLPPMRLALGLLAAAAFFTGGILPRLRYWLVRHPAEMGQHIPLQ